MNLLVMAAFFPAFLVAQFFMKRDPGEPEPHDAAYQAAGFGLVAIIAALILSFLSNLLIYGGFFPDEVILETYTLASFLDTALFATIEEFVKFIPFALFVYSKKYFNEMTDGIIYFAIVGLSFGAIETLLYSMFGGGIFTIMFRYGIGLFLHGALTSLVGYTLIKKKLTGGSFLPVAGALIAASLVHTLYNAGIDLGMISIPWLIMTGFASISATSLMFIAFYNACKLDYKNGRSHLLPESLRNQL